MSPKSWSGWGAALDEHLTAIRDADRWRHPRAFDALGPTGRLDGAPGDAPPEPLVSFASNDYLGLTSHPAVIDAAIAATTRWGTGSGASRLVVGSRPVHDELEQEIADWKHTERAVLFPTGYAANLGVITALARAPRADPRPVLVSDELNHASIIDACRLAAADVVIYPHLDLATASTHLERAADDRRPAILISDTVFSMDGDTAPVDALASLAAEQGALLVLDEAHAVLGPDLAADPEDAHPASTPTHVVRVTTLSKTLGSLGGAVACAAPIADLLVNRARPYIFTTALSPADTAAGLEALRVLRSTDGDALVARLRRHIDRLRPGHPSPIVPIVVGSDAAALAAAEAMRGRGLLVPAIRPPTVPAGTARLRVTLSAAHTDAQVDQLIAALDALDRGDAP